MSGVCNDCHNHPCVCGMDAGGVRVERPVERTYGGVTLEEIKQSPRAFGEVSVVEGLCAHIAEMEAAFNDWQFDLADGADHRYQMRVHQISKTM